MKGYYRVLDKAMSGFYCLYCLPFCEDIENTGRKVKELSSKMNKISSTMVIHMHVDGEDTIFDTMPGLFVNNLMENGL